MSDIFSVLADPTRRALLLALAAKSQSVGDLVTLTGEGQPTVSKHLKTLREAGLVTVEAAGQARVYSIDRGPLGEIAAFINDVAPGFGGEGAGASGSADRNRKASSEASAVEETLTGAAVVLAGWISSGASWLNGKVQEKVAEVNIDADDLGKKLGRKLAEAQAQATETAGDLETQLRAELADFTDKLGVRAADLKDAAEVIIADVMASASATIDSVRGDKRKSAEADAKPDGEAGSGENAGADVAPKTAPKATPKTVTLDDSEDEF